MYWQIVCICLLAGTMQWGQIISKVTFGQLVIPAHNRPVNLYPDIWFIRLTWYFFRVWNFKESTLFFQILDHICSACNLQFKREEVRLPLLFLNNKKKILTLFFHLVFCTPYFEPYLFQGRKPTHVFTSRIVSADWLDKGVST